MELVNVLTFTREADCAAIESVLREKGISCFISGKDNCANDGLPKRVMVDSGREREARLLLKSFGAAAE